MEDEFAYPIGVYILAEYWPLVLLIAIAVLGGLVVIWIKENFRTELSDFWSLSLKPYLKFLGIHKKRGGDGYKTKASKKGS